MIWIFTAQKMKFSVKDFFRKHNQIRRIAYAEEILNEKPFCAVFPISYILYDHSFKSQVSFVLFPSVFGNPSDEKYETQSLKISFLCLLETQKLTTKCDFRQNPRRHRT